MTTRLESDKTRETESPISEPQLHRIELVDAASKRLFGALITLLIISTSWIILNYLRGYEFVPLVLSMLVGQIGGFVSLQRRLKSLPDDDLQLINKSWIYTLLPPFVGGILAMLLFLLFLSGMIEGEIFPVFAAEDPQDIPRDFTAIMDTYAVGHESYAKIIIWSFVAGYSEKFVIDIIGKFESSNSN